MRCAACGHDGHPDGARFCARCGAALGSPLAEAMDESLPGTLAGGRYAIVRLVGEGGRKRVYLARDTLLDRDVAVALLKTEGLDASGLARLRRETQTMARLGDHPHIVTIHDVGEGDGRFYIVIQYMPGGSVDDLLAAAPGRRLSPPVAVRIAREICEALEHAHRRGVVHRDLKPGNVWLTEDGGARLGDFGLAVALDRSRLTTEGAMIGTVAYMPPEQALGRPPDARSDLYALGATLYEMVTGRPPFVGDDIVAVISQHLHTPPVAPTWHNPDVPRALEALILRLLAKAPSERPESAAAVGEMLAAIADAPAGAVAEPAERANPLDRLASGAFVGREQETAELRGALDGALGGRVGVVLLSGEPGIGKTRLTEECATYAELRDARVLWGRCYEGEGAPAFWPWIQIIRAYVHQRAPEDLRADLGPGAGDIAQVVSAIRERLPELPAPSALEPEHARFRLFDSVTTFLRNAAARQPLLLILDDLHWADVPSLRLLEFLARHVEGARLLVIGTYRDVEVGRGHPLAPTVATLAHEPSVQRMALHGLESRAVARFIEVTAGLTPPEALVATVHRETEGNPFFMTEVVRLLVADRRLEHPEAVRSWSVSVPQGVREVVARRMHHLSADCARILSLASVIGREFRLDVLARVAELDPNSLAELLDEAIAARVVGEVPRSVGRYRFAHALIRETLYDEVGGARRARLHRRTGEALEEVVGEQRERHLSELAHHFLKGAAGGGDVAKGIRYALAAAERALALLAYEEAARLYELALRAHDLAGANAGVERVDLLLALATAQSRAGDGVAAREAFTRAAEEARRAGRPAAVARAALGFAGPWGSVGVVDSAVVRQIEDALGVLADADGGLRARLLGRLAVELVWADDAERRLALSREAVDLARASGDADALAFALYCRHWALMGPDNLDERLSVANEIVEHAERGGNREMALHGRTQRIQDLLESGNMAAVDREIAVHARLAEELRQPLYLWYAAIMRTMRASVDGRFDEARALAFEALALGQRVRPREALQLFGAQSFPAADLQGRFDELEGGLGPLTALVAENPAVPAWRAALAYVYCRLGRDVEARTEFARLAAGDFRDVRRNQEWPVCVNTLALVCAMLGDRAHAATLYRLFLPYERRIVLAGGAVTCFGSAARALGLLAVTLGRWDEANAHFETAIATNTAMGARPYVALSQHDHAEMLLARGAPGGREEALRLLTPALAVARDLGMTALVESGLRLRLRAQGLETADMTTSIDAVAATVVRERAAVGSHAAPDGTVTVLFTDIEGFTVLTERLGDRRAQELLHTHNAMLRRAVATHGGFEVKSQGDGFMIAFASAARALRCAIDLQRELAAYTERHPDEPLRVRSGLHTGEVIREADDFFGKHVILAARIAALATGGTILASQTVRELTESAREFVFDPGRDVQLKGLSGTYRVFGVDWRSAPASRPADWAS